MVYSPQVLPFGTEAPHKITDLQITNLPKMAETPSNLGHIKLPLWVSLCPMAKAREKAGSYPKAQECCILELEGFKVIPSNSFHPAKNGGETLESLYSLLRITKERQPVASLGPSPQICILSLAGSSPWRLT